MDFLSSYYLYVYFRYIEALAVQRQLEEERRKEEKRKEEEKKREEQERMLAEQERLKKEVVSSLSISDINSALDEFDNIISNLTSSSGSILEVTPTNAEATPTMVSLIQERPDSAQLVSPIHNETTTHDDNFDKENPRPLSAPLVAVRGRVKSPFLRDIQTPDPGHTPDSTHSKKGRMFQPLPTSQSAPLVVMEIRTTPVKEAPPVHKKPSRVNQKGMESNQNKPRPQSDDLLLDSLSDEDLIGEVPMATEEAEPKQSGVESSGRRVHSVSDAEETLKPPPLMGGAKSHSFEESCELTRGFSPDDMYHVNYQWRHSAVVCESNDSGVR